LTQDITGKQLTVNFNWIVILWSLKYYWIVKLGVM